MPKVPSALYNHNVRSATARQLNISSSASGRTSLAFPSSQVPLEPITPNVDPELDSYAVDMSMDIDDDHDDPDATRVGSTIEVAPGLHIFAKQKAKRYENLVCFFAHPVLASRLPLSRMFL